MKVKLFWKKDPQTGGGAFGTKPTNAQHFEDEINAWLSANPRIRIVEIKHSASAVSTMGWGETLWFVSVWYEDDAACPTPTPAS